MSNSKRAKLNAPTTLTERNPHYDRDVFTSTAKRMFGQGTNIVGDDPSPYRRSLDHATTGIPYSVSGQADLVRQEVAHAMAVYSDPIKLVLPVAMKLNQKVVVRRKFVVGGGTMITPEHAPARIVSLREEEVEFVQVRFGCAVTFNTNEFLLKNGQAEQDFKLKVDAQVASMQQQWNRLGYEQLVERGVRMTDQLARTSVSSTNTTPKQRRKFADETYVHAVFAAFNKYVDPIGTLLLQAKSANGFDDVDYNMMLLGAGALGAEKYTRECATRFSITGIPSSDGLPHTVAAENIRTDPRTNLMIGIVQPFPDSASATTPYAVANGGGLTSEVDVGTYYVFPSAGTYRIPNMGGHSWTVCKITAPSVAMRVQRCVMTSALLCKTGSETGEMFFGYPSTQISVTPNTEFGQVDIRTYFGAALYEPKNCMVLEDVQMNRVLSSERTDDAGTATAALNDPIPLTESLATNPWMLTGPVHFEGETDETEHGKLMTSLSEFLKTKSGPGWNQKEVHTLYPGRIDRLSEESGWTLFQANEGHLGILEDPMNPAAYGHIVHNGSPKG